MMHRFSRRPLFMVFAPRLLLSSLFYVATVDGYHIEPLPPSESASERNENVIDVSGLGGDDFYNYAALEIQVMNYLPMWTLINLHLSDNVFFGQTEDETVVCTISNYDAEDGQNIVTGTIRDLVKGMVYSIQRNVDGQQIVTAKSQVEYPDETDPPDVPSESSGGNFSVSTEATSLPPTLTAQIDVLIVWTERAECEQSNQPAGCRLTTTTQSNMIAAIDSLFRESNAVHKNSGTGVILKHIGLRDTSGYVETSDNTLTLKHLATKGDGYLDYIHPLRTDVGADLVQIISAGGNFCGIAYLFNQPPADQFSQVDRDCIVLGQYSSVHELAHNMGCRHDRGSEDKCTDARNTYYGYRDPFGRWRTVMAFDCKRDQCDKNPSISCPRVPYFSGDGNYNWFQLGAPQNNCQAQIKSTKHIIASYYTSNLESTTPAPTPVPTRATPGPVTPYPTAAPVTDNCLFGVNVSTMSSYVTSLTCALFSYRCD